MHKLLKNNLIVFGGIFILVLGVIVLVIFALGKAYRGGLDFLGDNTPQQVEVTSQNKIRKIKLKKVDSDSCLEITPDGVVRTYGTCGGDLSSASRLGDPSNINKLYNLISGIDLSKYKIRGSSTVYEITVETDTGTVTYYLPGSGNDGVGQIIQVIGDIQQNLIPSPSPVISSPPEGESIPSSSPSSSGLPQPSSSGGIGGGGDIPFTCGFTDSQSGNKPIPISNIVCSTEPTTP